MDRITHLNASPIVGQRYLVPTVEYPWLCDWSEKSMQRATKPWPVFLPRHEDRDHLHFPHQHYHVDPRFLNKADARRTAGWFRLPGGDFETDLESCVQRFPLYIRDREEHPPVVWMPRRCFRSSIRYQHGDAPSIRGLREHFRGQQCAASRGGWLCPHKSYPLGSIAPDESGVLTCPLHGLQIDAKTGRVLGECSERAAA